VLSIRGCGSCSHWSSSHCCAQGMLVRTTDLSSVSKRRSRVVTASSTLIYDRRQGSNRLHTLLSVNRQRFRPAIEERRQLKLLCRREISGWYWRVRWRVPSGIPAKRRTPVLSWSRCCGILADETSRSRPLLVFIPCRFYYLCRLTSQNRQAAAWACSVSHLPRQAPCDQGRHWL
jgi:hypothetical protein